MKRLSSLIGIILLSLNAIAQQFHLHRVSFSRMFQASYGIAPVEYLISLRLQKGISLLLSSTLSVKEIARKCGFSSGDYFAKVIRKATGLSPLIIRKRQRA